ncbi:GumC family protein [Rhodoblastus sp.]|uniref:GumC family protein n=1 Tax=Rhodoblastus sp. TaxID=1962975 RepID=UPI003F9B442B
MSLSLVLQVLLRRAWILGLAFISTLVGAGLLLLVVPARYDATATASIDPGVVDPVSGLTSGGNAIMILQGNLVALAKSNRVALAVVKQLAMDTDPASQKEYQNSSDSGVIDIDQWLANQILKHLDAKFEGGSNVIDIIYKGSAPQQSAAFANAFMAAFVDAAIASKGATAQKAADWFTPQIEKIRAELADKEGKLEEFQISAKLLEASTADADIDQVVAVTGDLSKAKADLIALQTQIDAPPETAATGDTQQSGELQTINTIRGSLANLKAEIATVQTTLGANNPKLLEKLSAEKSMERQIDQLFESYHQKLRSRIAAQKDKIVKLETASEVGRRTMIGIQGKRQQFTSLKNDVAFYRDELDRIEKAANQARLQSQLSFSNIAVIDHATPPTSASFPKPLIVWPLAAFLGLGLGVILSLLAEALDRRVRAKEDLEFVTQAPFLGETGGENARLPRKWPRLAFRFGASRNSVVQSGG